MDIYEYLKLDHDHVSHLFKQFSKSDLIIRKKQIILYKKINTSPFRAIIRLFYSQLF
jgi:hypothetical protein